MKFLLILAVGLGIGYYLGYSDGAEGRPSIAQRIVEQVGGESRGRVRNDIDATMEKLEGNTPSDSAKAAAATARRARRP